MMLGFLLVDAQLRLVRLWRGWFPPASRWRGRATAPSCAVAPSAFRQGVESAPAILAAIASQRVRTSPGNDAPRQAERTSQTLHFDVTGFTQRIQTIPPPRGAD